MTTVNGNSERYQLRSKTGNGCDDVLTITPVAADTADCRNPAQSAANACVATAVARTGRLIGNRRPSMMTTGVISAHVYHPLASDTNARHTDSCRPLSALKTTVSSVESSAGSVHKPASSQAG